MHRAFHPTQQTMVYTEPYVGGHGSVRTRLEAVQSRYPMASATVNGQPWRWRRTGRSSQPLLLLPGIQAGGDIFFELARLLGDEFDLVLATPPPIVRAEAMAAAIKDFIDFLGIGKVDLYGSSIGGYFAQAFALSAPHRVDGIFLANTFVDAAPIKGTLPAAHDVERMDTKALFAISKPSSDAPSCEGDPGQTALHEFYKVASEQGREAASYRAKLLALICAKPLAKLALPDDAIIVIDDDGDPVMPAPMREAVRERYARSLQVRIHGGGHQPAVQRPLTLASFLRRQLASQDTNHSP
jgi:maspardin